MTRSATPRHGLEVDTDFAQFIEAQVLPGTGVTADAFWQGYAGLLDMGDEPAHVTAAR